MGLPSAHTCWSPPPLKRVAPDATLPNVAAAKVADSSRNDDDVS